MSGLSLSQVSYSYGPKRALDAVSFAVAPGRFCALLGPNGAGKSTLFSLLTRLIVTRDGQISVARHDLSREPRAALARIGVVFQQPTLDLDMSVRQNLRYFAGLHGLSGRRAADAIETALTRLGMAERGDELVRALNGGHRRRMEIARALVHAPDVLLLDEPTVGLDAAARAAITNHVHDLADAGMAVLWATHLVDEIRPADQVVVLHKGKVLYDGEAGALAGDSGLGPTFLSLTAEDRVAAA